ncbi:riboflavin synthase alpha chain [Sinobacterium caligoides]|uniref:Riboflavin synthase n=1 Tax=Sinobacterium caligoides TaxID=933926 RepID=A0A3N2DYA8_9GAMM|nr:riboflavin synthase subunit alpha [Sinobacterium caligoides]ROS04840.1 riboflavin synthase alpha chain [Sinobacterium caligoides]
MYTGIVQGAFPLHAVERLEGLNRLQVKLPTALLEDLVIGASVGMDGVCLTVTHIEGDTVSFDVMAETLRLTTLGEFAPASLVNIERSAKQGGENGGHNVSGHVDGTVIVSSIVETENNVEISYQVPKALMPYIFKKGFIGLNGCSLTVANVDRDACQFSVCLIPETLRVTTHGEKQLGDRVNVEVDRQTQVIVDTVRAMLQENPELFSQPV